MENGLGRQQAKDASASWIPYAYSAGGSWRAGRALMGRGLLESLVTDSMWTWGRQEEPGISREQMAAAVLGALRRARGGSMPTPVDLESFIERAGKAPEARREAFARDCAKAGALAAQAGLAAGRAAPAAAVGPLSEIRRAADAPGAAQAPQPKL